MLTVAAVALAAVAAIWLDARLTQFRSGTQRDDYRGRAPRRHRPPLSMRGVWRAPDCSDGLGDPRLEQMLRSTSQTVTLKTDLPGAACVDGLRRLLWQLDSDGSVAADLRSMHRSACCDGELPNPISIQ